jgi:(S)-2-hydroxy-acid oxidase
MVVSSGSGVTIEQLAEREPQLVKWFQMFIYEDRVMTRDMAQRAERAGYKALVITVDQNTMGLRYHNMKNAYTDEDERVNYRPYGVSKEVARDATWEDVKWLKGVVNIPVVIKGVLTAEDSRLAVNAGADAIFVSNHGGRQLDGSPATVCKHSLLPILIPG